MHTSDTPPNGMQFVPLSWVKANIDKLPEDLRCCHRHLQGALWGKLRLPLGFGDTLEHFTYAVPAIDPPSRPTDCPIESQETNPQERDPLQKQIGGNHYKDLAIQPAEYCQRNGLRFLESNAIKYITRHGSKGKAQDIRKAIHCLELLLEIEYSTEETK